ncbi:unnamed protein product [Mytilus edulis]|uniref:Uncharacterized protein n=1 Tax=Mytilus edulis TaxID=6550 RepID=A0A8S3T5Q1_MYTED|nr:unnamed protein product [Mytilus edulis]
MKSGYKPTFANNAIENYIFATKIELDKIKLKPFKYNLDRTERQGLKSLRSNKDIVIKKADKNASTVILDKQTYLNQAMKQLNDNINYTQLSEANNLGISKTIENKINQLHLKGYVDDTTRNYLNSNKEKQTALDRSRASTLKYRNKSRENIPLCFITKYNPMVKQLGKTIRKHWHIIEKDETAKQLFQRPPIIAYKKQNSLKDMLTSSKLR